MQHNYEKIKITLALAKADKKDNPSNTDQHKIDWKLEVLKKDKPKMEELISWYSNENEFNDIKMLVNFMRDPGHCVLHLKAEKEGLKQFCNFRIKELANVPCEIIVPDDVQVILDALPDFPVEEDSKENASV